MVTAEEANYMKARRYATGKERLLRFFAPSTP